MVFQALKRYSASMYYTKYRPQTFSEIRRPNEVADSLMQQIKTGKTAHAYLFTGPRGTGKTTMARLLAKGLNCEHITKEGDVCGECEYCRAVQNGSLVDLIEIDAASNRGIDDIRDLRDKVKLLPAEGKKKVYIIDEVHMLTNEAFNALLKTLEEPPKHVVFILCTTEFHKVPETIRSRCQVYKFKRPTKVQIVDKLKYIAGEEWDISKISEDEFERIATMAGGAFRDAETILQQLIEGGGSGILTREERYADFINALKENHAAEALKILGSVYDNGVELSVWTEGLLRYLRDLMYLKMGFGDDYFALTPEALAERRDVLEGLSREWIVKAVEVFNQTVLDVKSYSVPQLAIEIGVIKLTGESPEPEKKKEVTLKPKPTEGPKNNIEKKEDVKSSSTKEPEKSTHKEAVSQKASEHPALNMISEKWKDVVSSATRINNSVGALLKSGKPVGVEDNFIILEVSYKFHKERLESTANKKIVEKALEEFFEDRLTLKCIVNPKEAAPRKEGETGDLTDLNIRVPVGPDLTKKATAAEVFDGALPL